MMKEEVTTKKGRRWLDRGMASTGKPGLSLVC